MRRIAPYLLVLCAACGGSQAVPAGGDGGAGPDQGTVSERTTVLTQLEARWMCDVTRFAYQDLGELQAELDARLGGAGLTRDDYDAFKAELASNEARRAEVVAAYDGLCGD